MAKSVNPEKKQTFTDYVMEPFGGWQKHIQPNIKQYYFGLLKIAMVNIGLQIILALVFGLLAVGIFIAFFGMEKLAPSSLTIMLLGNSAALISLVLVVLAWVIVSNWVSTIFQLAPVVYTDAVLNKRGFSIKGTAGVLKGKAFRLMIVEWLISLVLMLPLLIITAVVILGLIGSAGSPAMVIMALVAMPFLMMLGLAYLAGAIVVYTFIAQFWGYCVAMESIGVIDALKHSFRLVTSRIPEVLVFDILLLIIAFIVAMPLIIYEIGSSVFFDVYERLSVSLGFETWVMIYVILVVLNMIMSAILTIVVQAVMLPTHYLFWKKVKQSPV